MPTVDELLNASNEVTTCTINPDTREIIVPEKYEVLGVFSDEKVTKIPFTCPRVVGNNVDLTEYNLYINYENAIGKSNAYLIEDVVVSGDNITFSWLLSRNVTLSPGVVKYSFCAKKLVGDTISNEWNTTIATGLVIQGLEATREIIEENPDIIGALISKAHTHTNKLVLDKFAETDGKPTYNGEALGGGTSDFIIKMTVEANGENYTVTSCDKTTEQIDAAVARGQNIKAIAFDKFVMPLTQIMENGVSYTFGAFLGMFVVIANVNKNPESGTDEWEFYFMSLAADIVEYSNDAMPNIYTVGEALDELVPKSHTHTNKLVLDKFSETDGKPTYNGEALGGGTSDFIIKMTVAGDENGNYTVTSCDATIEQIDSAVAAEKRVVLIATDTTIGNFWELPIVEAYQGQTYIFIAYTYGRRMMATVYKSGENEIWEFVGVGISAESVDYFNSTQPDVESVHEALNKLFTNQVTKGTNITLADNTEYRLTSVTTLTLTYPTGNFECWMRLSFAASGEATVILPTGTKYIGTTPDFKKGETWEMSIKDGVVIAQKVGDGT